MRVTSATSTKNGGYLHCVTSARVPPPERTTDRINPCEIDAMAKQFRRDLSSSRLADAASMLGVSEESLVRLEMGWSYAHNALSFPMVCKDGAPIGIRLRRFDGRKFAVRGGREGIFWPEQTGDNTMICEGPTSLAALLTLGFHGIGRPSCTGAIAMTVKHWRRYGGGPVVIFGDRDADKVLPNGTTFNPGRDGAVKLAQAFAANGMEARVAIPPLKDLRDWLRAGATQSDVLRLAARAPIYMAVKARAA